MTDPKDGTEDGVADPEHHLTAEDAGSTTDPADLVEDEDEVRPADHGEGNRAS